MGVFDFFSREEPKTRSRENLRDFGTQENISQETKNPFIVYKPKSFEEVSEIIDSLKNGHAVVVHLEELKTETALRVLDMLCGAVYALNGGVYEMNTNVFMFSKEGVQA